MGAENERAGGTAEPVSRDRTLRRKREEGAFIFLYPRHPSGLVASLAYQLVASSAEVVGSILVKSRIFLPSYQVLFSPNEQHGGGGGWRCQTFSCLVFLFSKPRAGLVKEFFRVGNRYAE